MKQKLLITGISGLLGNNLAWYFRDKYEILGVYHKQKVSIPDVKVTSCDLTEANSVESLISRFNPDIVIHSASLTNIDQCEADKHFAEMVNVKSTKYVVDSISQDTYLIYISSDSVYKGDLRLNSEIDKPDPQNYYGLTKLLGEREIQRSENSLILRTNIFGWNIVNKNSLGELIFHELRHKNQFTGFQDARFSSIYTIELAAVIDLAIQKKLTGLFNCGSRDNCSKHDFAVKLARQFSLDESLISRGSMDEFAFSAKRGKSLSLNCDKLERELDYNLPTVDYSIERFYRDYQTGWPNKIKKYNAFEKPTPAKIPYGRQWIDKEDIDSVVSVLKSDWITQGPNIVQFEEELARYCDARHATVVNSGTAGLHIACLSAGLGPGDEVITTPISFVATANSIVFCGATPVFADIDPRTYNVSPLEIEKKITEKTKAIIPVHFAGQSCQMKQIREIVEVAEAKYRTKICIIEDASHALGSIYNEKKVGSGEFSDMSILSFHPVKHITTGEGGAVLTNNAELANSCRLYRNHGITSDRSGMTRDLGSWYYEQLDLGYNYRITDLQCVLGISQLNKLEMFRDRRREIVNSYNSRFKNLPYAQIPYEASNCLSNFHLYVLSIGFQELGISRNTFKQRLEDKGVLSQIHYIPIHIQPYYREHFGTKEGDFPIAENYFRNCLSIPLFPAMHDEHVNRVIDSLTELLGE